MHMLQDCQTRHQPDGQRRPAPAIGVNRAQALALEFSIDRARQLGERVSRVDDLIQPSP